MKIKLGNYKLLGLLVLADLTFIFLHILHVFTPLLPANLYSLSRDRGYAEFFQYTKELWIAVLFLAAAIQGRQLLYAIFSTLFTYFLLDDSFEFHESTGALLADTLHLQPLSSLRPVDMGELLVSAFFGVLFLAGIAIAYSLSQPHIRRVAIQVLLMIAVMTVFGLLLDMLEIITPQRGLSEIIKILEEGGEMLVMSLITAFAFNIDFARS